MTRVLLNAVRKYRTDTHTLSNVADAKALAMALTKTQGDFISMQICIGGERVGTMDVEPRYEWAKHTETPWEGDPEQINHFTVWVWKGSTIAYFEHFDGVSDAMAFATASKRADGVDHVQVEDPKLGKITDWWRELVEHWGKWVDVGVDAVRPTE